MLNNTTTSFIPVNTSGELYSIALTPDGSSAIVTTFSSDSPKRVNLQTSGVQNIAGITSVSYSVAILNDGSEALIFDGDSLDLVSLSTNSVIKKISSLSFNTSLQNIAISNDDKYAVAIGAFEKLIISLEADTVIQTFTAGGTNVAINSDGSKFYVTDSYNGTVRVYSRQNTSVVNNNVNAAPSVFELKQNYPNPFNPVTEINYSIPASGYVSLKVYNLLGQVVSELYQGYLKPGSYKAVFDASKISSGVYLYRLQFNKLDITKKMIIMK